MLTVEQYITQMKKKDKLDEFNFKNHAENMTTIIKYVMDYFNNYLNPEAYDYEKIKIDQTVSKIEQEIQATFPKSKNFIIQYYKKYLTRIDKVLKNWVKDQLYMDLFYLKDDYEKTVSDFCNSAKMKNTDIKEHYNELIVLSQEIKENEVDKPSISDFKNLDNSLIAWVKGTYREYGVNLLQFAHSYTNSYYDEYIETIYDREAEQFYHINKYNHRYNNNPFEIDEIYEDNKHRPFINGKKGELEMLLMYEWLFDHVEDSDYWPEYVNLCISTGRVNIVKNINTLIPVKYKGINYPDDIRNTIVFIETINGSISDNPDAPYILRLNYSKDNDKIWKSELELNITINNLVDTFTKYGVPYALELFSPLRSPTYNEEEFFAHYRLLEKGMRKYTNLKIALVNGPSRSNSKPKYLMQSIDDIIKIRNIVKEMKFKLKIAVDISKLINKRNYGRDYENVFNSLCEIRNSIICIHLSSIIGNSVIHSVIHKDDKAYLNKFDYPQIPDFLSRISALFNDNQKRYFVPEGIGSNDDLEELVDDLLRGGFSFSSQEED